MEPREKGRKKVPSGIPGNSVPYGLLVSGRQEAPENEEMRGPPGNEPVELWCSRPVFLWLWKLGTANGTVGEANSFIIPHPSDRSPLKDKSKSVVGVERCAIRNPSLPPFCAPSGFPSPSLTVAQSCSSCLLWVTSHSTRGMAAVKLSEILIIAIAASDFPGCNTILFFIFGYYRRLKSSPLPPIQPLVHHRENEIYLPPSPSYPSQ